MKQEFLFEVFPFINGEQVTLCQIQESDSEALIKIFKDNDLMFGALSYINTIDNAFRIKSYIELGFYNKEKPNELLGTINIGRIDTKLESVSIELLYRKGFEQDCEHAIDTISNFLFAYIDVKRVYTLLKNPDHELECIFANSNFEKEGHLKRASYNLKNEICDLVIYAKLNSDN